MKWRCYKLLALSIIIILVLIFLLSSLIFFICSFYSFLFLIFIYFLFIDCLFIIINNQLTSLHLYCVFHFVINPIRDLQFFQIYSKANGQVIKDGIEGIASLVHGQCLLILIINYCLFVFGESKILIINDTKIKPT